MVQARVERALERVLPAADHTPQRLHEAMRYAVLGSGKRVRPMLAFAAGEATDAPLERLDAVACALELIHAYSLVHDDLPCMDDDVLRRGKPTVHVEFDEATALLVGDALQSLAFQVLAAAAARGRPGAPASTCCTPSRWRAARAAWPAARRSTSRRSARRSTLPELEFMHILKTGALIRASVALGRALRRGARARRGRAARPVREVRRARVPGGRRRARRRGADRDPGQDRGQGRRAGQADLRLPARHRAGEGAARRSCGATPTPRSSASATRAGRLRDLADFIVTREF